jgi:hypothetical protein
MSWTAMRAAFTSSSRSNAVSGVDAHAPIVREKARTGEMAFGLDIVK